MRRNATKRLKKKKKKTHVRLKLDIHPRQALKKSTIQGVSCKLSTYPAGPCEWLTCVMRRPLLLRGAVWLFMNKCSHHGIPRGFSGSHGTKKNTKTMVAKGYYHAAINCAKKMCAIRRIVSSHQEKRIYTDRHSQKAWHNFCRADLTTPPDHDLCLLLLARQQCGSSG